MKIIAKPKPEKKILASTKKTAKAEDIRKAILVRSENCVESRCGCGTSN